MVKTSNIKERIQRLKQENNAIILAHNYQRPEIQDIGDYVGDSFGLAQQALKTDADYILFCGVDFMAESAKILNPDKTVIHPDIKAVCPMAAMVEVEPLKFLKQDHPDAAVVSYVNTSAAVKAQSDICCTSSNAVEIIQGLDEQTVLFLPDVNLGNYVKRFVSDKDIILWPGICPTHHKIKKEHILKLKTTHPDAEVVVHPECNPDVIDAADFVFSTQGIINHVARSSNDEFIIGTEKELCYRLGILYPDKKFYSIDIALCPNMKRITLPKVLKSLQTLEPKVNLPDDILENALLPLQRMVDFGRGD